MTVARWSLSTLLSTRFQSAQLTAYFLKALDQQATVVLHITFP